jgi:hypothetical protein
MDDGASPLDLLAEEAGASEEAKRAEREGTLATLKAQHRHIRWWELDGFGLVVCRRMRRSEVLTFTKLSHSANAKFDADGDAATLVDANEKAVTTCCVWPKDRERLKQIFDEYTNFSSLAALAISRRADEGVTEGKE